MNAPEESRLQEAFEDGVERLAVAVDEAAGCEPERAARLSAGLRAGLSLLAADPPLAHLLFVEALDPASHVRLEYERSLERLGDVLGSTVGAEGTGVDAQVAFMLAGGLVSVIARRILAGEVERLPGLHDALLEYLLAPSRAASHRE